MLLLFEHDKLAEEVICNNNDNLGDNSPDDYPDVRVEAEQWHEEPHDEHIKQERGDARRDE